MINYLDTDNTGHTLSTEELKSLSKAQLNARYGLEASTILIPVRFASKGYTIEKFDIGDWIDLRAEREYHFSPGDYWLVSLGVAMKLPPGYEAILAARSSLFVNHGLIFPTGIGIIDNSYCGDNDIWKIGLYATRETTINRLERIAQFRIQTNQPRVEMVQRDSIGDAPNRGGVGSTGKF